jgi:hypothetical protein
MDDMRCSVAASVLSCGLLFSFGCKDRSGVHGKTVSLETGAPIAHSVVYVHTSKGNLFDRNQFNWILSSDINGGFHSDQITGRIEGIYAIAPGWYPNFAETEAPIRLRRIPPMALARRRGSVSVSSTGVVGGFNFTLGNEVQKDSADLVPALATGERHSIKALSIVGRGGIKRNPVDLSKSVGTSVGIKFNCLFLNIVEAPEEGYDKRAEVTDDLDIYIVRCADGRHYAKLLERYQELSPDGSCKLIFDYVYQPEADSRRLPTRVTAEQFEDCLDLGKRIDLSARVHQ